MKVVGIIKPTSRHERYNVEFPAFFKGTPTFKSAVTCVDESVTDPVACSVVITGWRGQGIVKAAWVHVWIQGGPDHLPFLIHYQFEGEAAVDERS